MERVHVKRMLTCSKKCYHRFMAPTLNQDDIKLLKGIFATKDDLTSMETRFGKKFATKDDLKVFAKKDDLVNFSTKTDIKNMETRLIKKIDDMDNFLDRETVRLAKQIDKVKLNSIQYA